jgi:hypothetical protein
MLVFEKPPRRARPTHPRVKLLRRTRGCGWVWLARWRDPDTGRSKEVSLDRLGLTTESARRGWCAVKSRSILQRRADLLSGAALAASTDLAGAVADFYTRRATLEKTTLASYRNGTDASLLGRTRSAWRPRRRSRPSTSWIFGRGGPCGRFLCRPPAGIAAIAFRRRNDAVPSR